MKEKSTSKYAVHKTQPVAASARSVAHETPTSSPGISGKRTYTASVPVKGSNRVVNVGRKD